MNAFIAQIAKQTLVGYVNGEGEKLCNKDADNVGKDDVAGRSLKAIASGIDAIDFTHLQDAKSLKNIGLALEAAGKKLQEEAGKV
jgi:hypothetical protein